MNTTLRIAKLEISTLFYSPIAWFLSIVFLFQCGLSYTSHLQTLFTYQQLGGEMLSNLNYATNTLFGVRGGLMGDVLQNVYLYLPLLTMGLISREVSSGTIKLLYSSPVKIREIIFGKFIAMMVYNSILLLIVFIFALSGITTIHSAETGLILSGLLALYLLLCTYSAIGLFMSCLTSYQVVAAISTLVVFAILAYIGTLWQELDFVRGITYFLSITGRAERMIYGLISTKDILYFLVIIFIFLGFSIIKLQSGRESMSVFKIAGRYIAVLWIGLVIGYVTSIPGFIGYYDTTANLRATLTPNTQKVLKALGDEPLEITSYINLLEQHYGFGQPSQRNYDLDRWEPYLRFKPNIRLNYVYYYDAPAANQKLFTYNPGKTLKEIADKYAISWKINLKDYKTPIEIKKIVDLSGEDNRYVMQLKYKGKTTFLRIFDDQIMFPTETETSAALKRLTVKLPKIVFVQGEFERSINKFSDKDYGILVNQPTNRSSLVNQGFDTDTISLQKQEIPEGIAALVIADPRISFSALALSKIRKYIAAGGSLLIAAEPGKQAILNPIVNPLGVQFTDGILVQKDKNFPPNMVLPMLTKTTASFSKQLQDVYKDTTAVGMPGVLGLVNSGTGPFTIKPLLVTDKRFSWNKKKPLVLDSAAVEYSAIDGDERKSFATALALTRTVNGKEQRIILSGDADFLSNAELLRWNTSNRYFDLPLLGWFSYGQFPIDTSLPPGKDNRLNLSDAKMTTMKVMMLGVLPGLLLLFATVFLIRRKRK